MKEFIQSPIQFSAVLLSVAVNLVLFLSLAAGFDGQSESGVTVVQLPSVTVVGKRSATEMDAVTSASASTAQSTINHIKL